MSFQHKIGDYVIYKNNGICKISDIRKEKFNGSEKMYYVLNSVYDTHSVLYVPFDLENANENMADIVTKDEINNIIEKSEEIHDDWVEDNKERTSKFEGIIRDGDRSKILWIVKILSLYKSDRETNKKTLNTSDAHVLSVAEKIITEEFAFTLNIDKDDVIPYIIDKVKNNS